MSGKRMILFVAVLALTLGAIPATAAETTRESYVQAVEPICKANTEANERILKGARAKVKAGKFKEASKQLLGAAKALKRTRAQLLQVPKPAADSAVLTKWLGYVKQEVDLFEMAGRKLAHGEGTAAQKLVVRLLSTAKQANNTVLSFEFRYCRFQPSKFL